MQNPTTVKELFLPLGERLFDYYESGKYIRQATTEYFIEIEGPVHNDGQGIINSIGKGVNRFDDVEVFQEAGIYHQRVKNILEKLEPTLTERHVYNNMDIDDEIKPVNGTRKKELQERHKDELQTYLNGLRAIMKAREGAERKVLKENIASVPSAVEVINLPENFTVKLLLKKFDPYLTLPQAALFLHYLRELKMTPSYSNASLGKLAEALFARNQKNITTNLTEINDINRNKAELTEFKEVLQILIKAVDKDLKEAR